MIVCGGVSELEYSPTVPVQAYSVRCGADPTLEGVCASSWDCEPDVMTATGGHSDGIMDNGRGRRA